MSVTTNNAAEWATVARPVAQVVRCPDCGHMRRDFGGPHAPRIVGDRRVDCAGREVQP